MKKYTHKALLALAALFLGLMTISALLLKKEVAITDLKDPDREYERIALPPFKYVYAHYSKKKDMDPQRYDEDTNTLEIAFADQNQLLINKSEKDSLVWKISQDTLYITGNDENLFSNPVAKLKCAQLLGVTAHKTTIWMDACQRDQLSVRLMHFARLEMYNSRINQFEVEAADHSIIRLDSLTANQLQINLRDTAELKLNNTRPQVFQLKNDQTGLVQLKGSSQQYMSVQ